MAPATPAMRDDIVRLFRDIPDWKIARIIGTGATVEDLEATLLWVQGESDVAGRARQPLTGRAALVYDIITADEDIEED